MTRLAVATVAALLLMRSAGADEVLTRVTDIRALSRAQAALRPAVRLRGVVTFKWGEGRESFCMQDEVGGVWVSVAMALTEGVWAGDDQALSALREGVEVEVDGVMDAGGYAPEILPRSLRVLGAKPLPPAPAVALSRLMSGAEDAQRVEVVGVVQRWHASRLGTWLLRVDTGLGRVLANVPADPALDPDRLVDAEVRLRGVVVTARNWRAQLVQPRLLVGRAEDVRVELAAPPEPFLVPEVALTALDAFSPAGRALHRRRLTGIVTYAQAGAFLHLQEGTCAVRIGTASSETFTPGDRVEATGFIDHARPVSGLSDALVRRLGAGQPPAPVATALADIRAAFQPVRLRGRPASPHDYDGLLVSVTGRLLDVQPDLSGDGRRLVLDCAGALSTAELRDGGAGLDSLLPGSVLRVVGVAVVHYAPGDQVVDYVEPTRLDLLLRDAGDVAVLRAPSWWTPRRLALALAGCGAVLVVSLAWTLAMRRLLRLRSARLEQVMRAHRDSELEFAAARHERRRLAADMHDGLQQLLAGAAFRLEAAAAQLPGIAPAVQAQFAAARGALLRTQEGLRACLWGLRQVEEGPGGFAALLEHAAASMEHWPRGGLVVDSSGQPFALARHVMGGLLLLMQEAAGNAFRHGRARQVRVHLAYGPEALEMRVEDDGAGFDPSSAPGTGQGHFGLESMRHRMSWLGGGIDVASRPGHGACVRIRLPRARAEAGDGADAAGGEALAAPPGVPAPSSGSGP